MFINKCAYKALQTMLSIHASLSDVNVDAKVVDGWPRDALVQRDQALGQC